VTTHPVSFASAQKAAELRAAHQLKTPDAIQLAVAINHGASRFLTNDRRIPDIPDLSIVRLADLI
jgi:predicted nucleic acid-binding protein